MKLEYFKPLCLLYFFLRSITFGLCQNSSSDASSNRSNGSAFPIITLGKDLTTLWYANVSFGTPNVLQQLRIDIGQPYTWSLYSMNHSTTANYLNNGYVYTFDFINSVEIAGPAVMDTINFTALASSADAQDPPSANYSSSVVMTPDYLSISNISFFEVNSTTFLTKGALGLGGRITNGHSEIDSAKFDNSFFFLDRLTNLGIIESPSYSLWLGADNVPYSLRRLPSGTPDNCGQLILGAVDPSLFNGRLHVFKVIPFIDPETHVESRSYPILPLGTIYINSADGRTLNMTAEEFIEPVLLDSRYSTSYLPVDAIVQIAVQIGAIYVESLSRWVVACSVANFGVQLSFSFGNMAITVPLEDFLVTTYDPESNTTMHFSDGEEACLLAMGSRSSTGYNILGGSFLKNAYMAFDLADNSIALAQAKRVTYSPESSSASSRSVTAQTSPLAFQKRAISSGYIPYAVTRNSSINMTMIPESVPSATVYIPDLFTGAVDSDGIISTGRSFYQTSRSTSSSRTTDTPYDTLLFSSMVRSSSSANGAGRNQAALSPIPVHVLKQKGQFTLHIMVLLAIVLPAFLL